MEIKRARHWQANIIGDPRAKYRGGWLTCTCCNIGTSSCKSLPHYSWWNSVALSDGDERQVKGCYLEATIG